MSVATVQEFSELLAKSGLLTQEQIAHAQRRVGDGADLEAFRKFLIENKHLTRWQFDELCAGRHNFMLGKYRLLEPLGSGRVCEVFKALQVGLSRVVALRVMDKSVVEGTQDAARFQREIRTSAALRHPCFASALHAETVGDTILLGTEFVDGESLKHLLREYGKLPIDWSCEFARQVAVGLQHAHEQGLVHRDIKPGNLMLVGHDMYVTPKVKILDMGLARYTGENEQTLTKTGQVLGTSDYIAPEQIERSKEVNIQADIFSLGCTLFQMLTGELPFKGANLTQKVLARMHEDAPPPSSLRAEIPAELDFVVLKMLFRDPGGRYRTPAEVAMSLAPFAMGGAPIPRPDGSKSGIIRPAESASSSAIRRRSRSAAGESGILRPPPEVGSTDDPTDLATRVERLERALAEHTLLLAEFTRQLEKQQRFIDRLKNSD